MKPCDLIRPESVRMGYLAAQLFWRHRRLQLQMVKLVLAMLFSLLGGVLAPFF